MHSPLGMARWTLYLLLALVAALLLWATLGKLDIVATARGKLVPATQIKIVQPVEAGIVKSILVREGEAVTRGQVLMRMDGVLSEADGRAIEADFQLHRLSLRRIDAELAGEPLRQAAGDPEALYRDVSAQLAANRVALDAAVSAAQSQIAQARHELAAAERIRAKLAQTLPHYQMQEQAFVDLAARGFSGKILAADKTRERIEREGDLRAQEAQIQAARALIGQGQERVRQLHADYRQRLRTERIQVDARLQHLTQEHAKLAHRAGMLELRAPQDGVIKNLATHTEGTVVSPGAILMTLVPVNERLVAEVWVRNDDIGFVAPGQPTRLKLEAFPFQKYGMVAGTVAQLGADATEDSASAEPGQAGRLLYKARVFLAKPGLDFGGGDLKLAPGMQVTAEITLGRRSVLEYLLSPVSRAFQQAGRER